MENGCHIILQMGAARLIDPAIRLVNMTNLYRVSQFRMPQVISDIVCYSEKQISRFYGFLCESRGRLVSKILYTFFIYILLYLFLKSIKHPLLDPVPQERYLVWCISLFLTLSLYIYTETKF